MKELLPQQVENLKDFHSMLPQHVGNQEDFRCIQCLGCSLPFALTAIMTSLSLVFLSSCKSLSLSPRRNDHIMSIILENINMNLVGH